MRVMAGNGGRITASDGHPRLPGGVSGADLGVSQACSTTSSNAARTRSSPSRSSSSGFPNPSLR